MRAVRCPVCDSAYVVHFQTDDALFCGTHGYLTAYWRRRLDGMSATDRIIAWHADKARQEVAFLASAAREELGLKHPESFGWPA